MLVHTKKPLTKTNKASKTSGNTAFLVSCPVSNVSQIKKYLEKQGCILVNDEQEWVDAKGLFAERTYSNMLIGARSKENITQIKLSELTGIPRRHISDMENGRRPIGKQNALKLGKALNVDYRVFL